MIRLVEGRSYNFEIQGRVTDPEGKLYIKIADPNGVRHLIENDHYLKYKIPAEGEIKCRVERINCSGKIYLEPEHPCYRLSMQYNFKILEIENGQVGAIAIFENCFGERMSVPYDELPGKPLIGEDVSCRIEKIKKGKVYISAIDNSSAIKNYDIGNTYNFTYLYDRIYNEKYQYMILLASNEMKVRLRKKYYTRYGFIKGDSIKCRIIDIDGEKYPEPEHPAYKPGDVEEFTVIGFGKVMEYPYKEHDAFILENNWGKDFHLKKGADDELVGIGDTIKCKIERIVRSELFLEKIKK